MIFWSFWVCNFLSFFKCLAAWHSSKMIFLMFWRSRNHPRFPIDLGNIIFLSKFSFFGPLMSTFDVQKLICISKLWPIWPCRLLKWSNTPRASENHPDLSDRSRDIHQTKLKRDLKSEPKLSRKFSMCGNYSEPVSALRVMWMVPSRPTARQHMRQHGKFEKIRSKKSSNA